MSYNTEQEKAIDGLLEALSFYSHTSNYLCYKGSKGPERRVAEGVTTIPTTIFDDFGEKARQALYQFETVCD